MCCNTCTSGGTATLGSASAYVSSPVSYQSLTYAENIGSVVCYKVAGAFKSRIITVSGTTITLGTEVTITTNNATNNGVVYDSTNNRVVVVYTDSSNSYYETSAVASISGTDLTYQTPVVILSSATPSVFNDISVT